MIEYLIIGVAIVLILYGCFSFATCQFHEKKATVMDSLTMYYPSSSKILDDGDVVKFRNSDEFYNLDVSRLKSTDERVENLLTHFSNIDNQGTLEYKNETHYVLTIKYPDDNGFNYHSMIIPIDSFNKDDSTFGNKTDVLLFDGNNREFVVDSAFLSEGVA